MMNWIVKHAMDRRRGAGSALVILCVLFGFSDAANAQFAGEGNTYPAIGPLQGAISPFVFSGTSRIEGQNANRIGTGSEIPQSYWRIELVPTLTAYGVPFSLNVLLSSDQSNVRQNVDAIGLFLNPQYYQDILRQKVSDKIDELENNESVKKIESIKDAYQDPMHAISQSALADSVKAQAPDATREMDKYQELQQLQDIRNSDISKHLDDVKSLGLMTGTESFFSNFPTLAVGVTYPNFTPLTLSGVPVTGANIEWTPGNFYLAVAGGQTQKAIVRDTLTVDYQNTLFAGAIGFGKKMESHFHLTSLYAKDNSESIPQHKTALDSTFADSSILFRNGPRANYVLGADLLVIPDEHFSLAAELDGSLLTSDTRDAGINNNDIPSWVRKLVDPTISSFVDYSYNVQGTVNLPESNSRITGSTRRVGPGYFSLGTPNLRNDDLRYEGKLDQYFDKRQISFSGFYRTEHDNLIPWKQATTTIGSYGVSMGLNFRKLPYFRISYSPYTQTSTVTDSALKASPAGDSLAINNQTTLISVLTGYNLVLGHTVLSTNFSFSKQDTRTRFGIGDYSSTNYNLNEIVNLSIPLTLSAGIGVIVPHALPDTLNSIFTLDLSGTYTAYDVWTSTLGGTIATQKNIDSKTGFYISTTFPLWKVANLEIRAEKNLYKAISQQIVTGPPTIAQSGNYDEFLIRATLTKSW
jgi:hypothetical protein